MLTANPSILITDDDPLFRETVSGIFEPRGFRTLMASDGETALKLLEHETVHIVLLDMHMPRLTGIETLRRLRRFRDRLPCILLSARLDDEIRQEAIREHAFSVLPKPITRLDLTNVVDLALHQAYGETG